MTNKKVLVAMSGGVDSSASAYLLKEQGYDVSGAIMRLWDKPDTEQSIEDARKVCENLGINFYVFDQREEFKETVIENFIDEYKNGRTPNPCVVCNKYLKFGAFLEKALEMGFDYIATGHYAKNNYDEKKEKYYLKKSPLDKKDQSYFLYNITQDILSHMIFPLADFDDKDEVRKLAEKAGIQVAKKPDSQEICFIPDNNHTKFIMEHDCEIKKMLQSENVESIKGNIVDKDGKVRSKHDGIIKYTIGQRKGLGISNPTPLFVINIDAEKNEVIVGEEKDLYKNELNAKAFHLVSEEKLEKGYKCTAKIRYAAKPVACEVVSFEKDKIRIAFEEPQRAITPGQSVVLYYGNIVIGGGIIE